MGHTSEVRFAFEVAPLNLAETLCSRLRADEQREFRYGHVCCSGHTEAHCPSSCDASCLRSGRA